MPLDLWQRGCERLATELPEQQFNTWIRPLPAAEVADEGDGAAVVTVRVPNRFKLDWIRNQYAGRIESVLSELAGKPVRLDIALAPRDDGARTVPSVPAANGHATMQSAAAALRTRPVAPAPGTAAGASVGTAQPGRSRLNPLLTFDTLVPGRANQMARTAALHVAGAPGQ